mmetsp:Transcript_50971/g.119590  ORF Transcript_50971/g.119590 Transcript_50971/m.119590 type:complete len:222 (-) Transcript_50971:303-968(-)
MGFQGLGVDRDDIHLLFREHLQHIAQQALAVAALDQYVDRIDRPALAVGIGAAPGHGNDALGRTAPHLGEIAAVAAVDGHALATGDKARDGVGRRRAAAARQRRQQRVDANHQHPTPARGAGAAGVLLRQQFILVGDGLGRAQQQLDIAQRILVLADHLEQRIGPLEAQACGQFVQLERGLALALQQLLDQLAALGHGLRQLQRVEPCPDLGPRTLALQIA